MYPKNRCKVNKNKRVMGQRTEVSPFAYSGGSALHPSHLDAEMTRRCRPRLHEVLQKEKIGL